MVVKLLEQNEYNILNTLAAGTGLDCWFEIRQSHSPQKGTHDYVYDREYHKKYTLSNGIKMLLEGIEIGYLKSALTEEEYAVLCRLCEDMGFALIDVCVKWTQLNV